MSGPQIPLAGTSPAGLAIPLTQFISGESPIFLADAIDPKTGEYVSIFQGFDPIDAWILTQLSVEKGSGSAVEDQGRDYRDVTHISERHQRILDQEIRRPLKPLVDARAIEITKLEIVGDETENDYDAKLSYRHISTDQERRGVLLPVERNVA